MCQPFERQTSDCRLLLCRWHQQSRPQWRQNRLQQGEHCRFSLDKTAFLKCRWLALLLTPHGRRSSERGDFPLKPVADAGGDPGMEPGIDAFCAAQARSRDCTNADWLDDESGNPNDCRWRGRSCEAR